MINFVKPNYYSPFTMIETMSFFNAVSSFMSKYFCLKGRARRSEYWFFFLFGFIIHLVSKDLLPNFFLLKATIVGNPISQATRYLLYSINWSLFIFLIPPFFTVTVRRLHDRNNKGWLVLILNLVSLVCLTSLNIAKMIGDERFAQGVLYTDYVLFFQTVKSSCLYFSSVCMIVNIILFTKAGTQGENKYGPDPTLVSQSN